ncbi:MAG: SDR family oxidoreductase, partial [Candidatus Omnitrophica bacterium]|nr:SDR family oxidoreductase [Candidatus Omnitrophota bacterium]
MPKKTVLITGGAGFIGSHLCDNLIARDFKVICMDNLITGTRDNIRHLLKDKNFRFVQHDIARPIKLKGKIDHVLHFASPASPQDYLRFPIETLKVGSLGTHNALGLSKEKKAKFLVASTSEIYGDPLEHPQKETYWGNVNSVGIRSCYDEAKRFSEALTMAYHRSHKLDTRIVRIFNTYGPRMRINDGRVVPNFIYQALTGKPITVYGKGSQTRSFCYVSDLVEGIYKLMLSSEHGPVNLGNPDEFTILEFAKMVTCFTRTSSKIVYKPLPQDDPRQRRPDISKAKRILKWSPKVSLKDGLQKTIE